MERITETHRFTLAEVRAVKKAADRLMCAEHVGDGCRPSYDSASFNNLTSSGICFAIRTEFCGGPSYDMVDTLFDLDSNGYASFGALGDWKDGLRLTAVAFIATIPARDLLEMLNA